MNPNTPNPSTHTPFTPTANSQACQISTGATVTVQSVAGSNAVITNAQGNQSTIPVSDLRAN